MKKEKGSNWKLGLFATIGLVLMVSAIYYIGKQKNLFGSVFRVRATFTNVSGLKVGNNVRFGGLNVGTVDEISLLTDTSVVVGMVVQKDVRRFIKRDASASIGSEGLMGDKVIVISPGTYSEKEVDDNGSLTSHDPIETDEIMSSLKISADNAAEITGQLSEIADKINHGHGALSKLLGDSAFANNITRTVTNLKKSSQGLSENMEAAKHNFLLRGYFKKKKRQEDKKKNEEEKKKNEEEKKKGEEPEKH
jgi:phospholipid/cholesterol/gamma-HCH transport system substrate-binding protein